MMASTAEIVSKRPFFVKMDGIIYPGVFSPKCFREALDYKPQAEDVFIVTYPKCGTTWMQNVALYIFRKGKKLEDMSQFLKYCPSLDMCGKEGIEKMPKPGAFKTHLPYTHMPYSSEAKYIFVARNPKDCAVSLFHHTRNHFGFRYWDGEFDEFFELFMAGQVEYGDYFDHLLSWYPHRNDPNLYHTTYEDMKKDIKKVIVDLAKFLGDEFIGAIEKDNSVFNNIVHFSSFEYMKKNFDEVYTLKPKEGKILMEPKTYEGLQYIERSISEMDLPKELPKWNSVRKGIVGDWKNALTEEQVESLDRKFMEKTKGTSIPNWFSISSN
ncbi:sulfotransferase ssu-1 [Parasteatoda tepidariorum]|uniref:sulfotransferase ssu-1 n=1 Tax=Parasteatoda tepidariorum TaxID=114398 RepID=UPI00077F843E|nr:sulfotransferase ssu-1 [Parasteatoda tepidariorum]